MNPLRSYLEDILMDKDPRTALEEVFRSGLLGGVFPEVHRIVGFGGNGHKDLWDHTKKVVSQTIREPHLRWAALFHDIGKPLCFTYVGGTVAFHHHEAVGARLFRTIAKRTRLFSATETDRISFIIESLGYVEAYETSWSDSAIRRVVRQLGDAFDDVCALSRADITTRKKEKRAQILRGIRNLRSRAAELQRIDAIPPALPKGLGTELMTHLGLSPSKELGTLMGQLRLAVEDGSLPRQPTIEEVLKYVRDIRR